MRILLIGERYSENLGDAVICETVEKTILTHYPDAEITMLDISGRVNYGEFYTYKKLANALKWKLRVLRRIPCLSSKSVVYRKFIESEDQFLKCITYFDVLFANNKFDIAIFAGGALFQNYFAFNLCYLLKKLKSKKIPVGFHAVGCGPMNDDTIKLFRKYLRLNNIKTISLRDSSILFTKLFNIEVIDTFDTAIGCSNFYKPCYKEKHYLGVGGFYQKQYISYQKKIVAYLLSSELDWKLFTNGSPSDYLTVKNILLELNVSEKDVDKYLMPRPTNSQELIDCVTSFEYIVSYRMHSQIIASSFCLPSFGFVWDNKVKTFYKKLGFQNCCALPSSFTVENINNKNIFTNKKILSETVNKQYEHSVDNLIKQIVVLQNK